MLQKHSINHCRPLTLSTTLIIAVAIATTLFYLNSQPTEATNPLPCNFSEKMTVVVKVSTAGQLKVLS